MKFNYTPRGVAGVFLLSRAPTCTGKDQDDLGNIIEDAFHQGIYVSLEKAKEIYRKLHNGGCRMLSKGESCTCFLCQIDNAAAEVRETKNGTR